MLAFFSVQNAVKLFGIHNTLIDSPERDRKPGASKSNLDSKICKIFKRKKEVFIIDCTKKCGTTIGMVQRTAPRSVIPWRHTQNRNVQKQSNSGGLCENSGSETVRRCFEQKLHVHNHGWWNVCHIGQQGTSTFQGHSLSLWSVALMFRIRRNRFFAKKLGKCISLASNLSKWYEIVTFLHRPKYERRNIPEGMPPETNSATHLKAQRSYIILIGFGILPLCAWHLWLVWRKQCPICGKGNEPLKLPGI